MIADSQEEVRKEYKPIHDYSHPFTATEEFRPLNVKDALSYLDKIKANFISQPDIYHQFLDIMKEFKSQRIDTPGVIERVSSLFQGFPLLIAGFNTFLPPGYHIECLVEDNVHIIKVTTPTGVTSVTDGEQLHLTLNNTKQPQERKEPIEFNHAITFVNKIKSQFANEPEVYKQFLDILQDYQKNQKPIQEVFAEIQALFNGSEELLKEFKQFLPETRQRKKRLTHMPVDASSKRSKNSHIPEVQTSNVRSDLKEDFKINFTQDETEFFKRVKTYISNEATYNAFVKVLNLFSQQMVDQDMLVSRVENFIGSNNELFDWFKELIGYEGKDHVIDNVPLGEKQTTKATMLENEHAYICGPSYRQISSSWQGSICSGRDALCWDVLNDGYMSCPTWSSEDTGYVTAKKNQYEEALHRVEEERYDYDLNIEANLNTIALLEPIVKKMTLLSVQEKQSFKLAPGLGGTCTTNYRRIIKKIYGNEKGLEIIDLLYNNPMQTVPIVLKRLKHKDDEWKRAQREWNKIWREVEAKNYQKSLDYKGIAFKLADKKKLAGRALVAEADEKRCQKTNPYFSYSFTDTAIFKDIARMIRFFLEKQPVYGSEDCGLMREFIDTFTSAYFDVSDVEPSVVEIMDTTQLMEADDDDKSSVQSVDSESVKKKSAIARANRRLRRGRPQQQDGDKLLKGVLKRNLNKKKSTDSSDDEDDDEDLEDDEEDEEYDAEEDGDDYDDDDDDDARRKSKRFQQKNQSNTPIMTDVPKQETKKTFNFFGNNGFYCFFRLYQTLYERLWTMKKLDLEFKEDPEKAIDARNEAYNLGVTHRKFKALNMDEKKGYYHLLLSLVDKLFEGDLDQQTFEASTRYIFGNDAYIIFTIDKLVLSILRYIHVIITDTQSQQLLGIFQHEHRAEIENQNDLITYRTRVAGVVKQVENTYHMAFNLNDRTLNIQLLGDNSGTGSVDPNLSGYDTYVANYIDWANETKGINQSLLRQRFLKRNLKDKAQKIDNLTVKSGMQYKICRNTYHMFYIIGTEDTFIRHANIPSPSPSTFGFNGWVDAKLSNRSESEAECYRLLNQ